MRLAPTHDDEVIYLRRGQTSPRVSRPSVGSGSLGFSRLQKRMTPQVDDSIFPRLVGSSNVQWIELSLPLTKWGEPPTALAPITGRGNGKRKHLSSQSFVD